jgi:glycosyltransferase involved in cell wall biosynthesis
MTPALWVAWLLRPDKRGGADLSDEAAQRDFVAEWFLYGRREYPNAPPLDEAALAVARERVPLALDGGTVVQLPRFMAALWRTHPELADRYDLASPRGWARYVAWFCISAVRQLGIEDLMPTDGLAPLFEPDEETPRSGGRPVSRLLRLAWEMFDGLSRRFDIATAAGQDGLHAWFADTGARECGLVWLIEGTRRPASPARPPRRALRPGGVNLIGFAYGQLGVGEDVRMLASSCEAAGIPFAVIARTPVGERGPPDRWLDPHVVGEPVFDVSILCMTGFDTASLYLEDPSLVSDTAYRIGFWPWELPRWPAEWGCAFDFVDEIWVSSRYTEQAIAASSTVPVLHMPMAVGIDRIVPRPRGDFGLPDDRLLFLYVFDGHSYPARKNPGAAVAAFRAAFPGGDEPVGLVVKLMGGDRADPLLRAFFQACAEDRRIVLIDRVMDRGDVLGLIAASDVYLSLHRAEGFGRTIAEAMLLGRPVIATGFSGSDELVGDATALPVAWRKRDVGPDEYPFGDGQWWADPDIEHAASCMRRLTRSPELGAGLAERARRLVASRHAPIRVGPLYADRLAAIRETPRYLSLPRADA